MYADAETLWRTTLAWNPQSYLAHNNLGGLLVRSGRVSEAIPHFERALEIQPDYAVACHNLGCALAQQGLFDEAIARFEQAVALDPEYFSPRLNLGNALTQRGRAAEAKVQFEAALRLRPNHPDVLNNLAWLLATQPDAGLRDGPRAMTLARQAEQLAWQQADGQLAEAIREQLATYQTVQPWRSGKRPLESDAGKATE